ncbi:ABC transporter permease [Alteribacter populi]|uniref:ABC transporter permease n=1 Tax=Alteribacter populi TaxID=2011011 RepID=UPI000BBAB6FF|nr:ABC transporter permease [Alteribacter populi]
MRNSRKVAKWEIKRNMMNKSFLISLFLTPALFLLFFTIPILFQSDDEQGNVTVYVNDELGVWDEASSMLDHENMNVITDPPFEGEESIVEELRELEEAAYLSITENSLADGEVPVYLTDDVDEMFAFQFNALEVPLRQIQLESLGLSGEEASIAAHGVGISPVSVNEMAPSDGDESGGAAEAAETDPFERLVPGLFAGLILFSVVITGMMIFQSASQEKKEKVAEMVLSSVTPTELMQGKILGYFVLGIVQVSVWLTIALPIVQWRTDIPVFDYLFVPELLILVFIAVAGYLLFASLFVSLGATVEDMNTSSNFQGIVMMLPWVPFILIAPILSDPGGLVAQAGTFFPLTSPGVMLIRLSIMEEWPWLEIIIALVVLLFSIWLLMKLAGKIFKTGILMYGKNATPQEIWKWIRH